jgi:hypothetical protein
MPSGNPAPDPGSREGWTSLVILLVLVVRMIEVGLQHEVEDAAAADVDVIDASADGAGRVLGEVYFRKEFRPNSTHKT